MDTSAALIEALDKAAPTRVQRLGNHRRSLNDFLALLARGQVVMETPRHMMIQDTINHWLITRSNDGLFRLMGAKVPALYGPSATTTSFGSSIQLKVFYSADQTVEKQAPVQDHSSTTTRGRSIH